MVEKKQEWGSRVGLILAMAGSAIGIGNFLRFPIQAVQNGGGAFIIPYIVSFILLGLPLALIEWSTGKYGGQYGHHSPPMVIQCYSKKNIWKYISSFSLLSGFVIMCYYSYIESWVLSYSLHSLFGSFTNLSEQEISAFFDNYLDVHYSKTGIPYENVISFVFCVFLNVYFLSKGIEKGIEKVAKVSMPLLLIFGLFLLYKAFTLKAGEYGASFDGIVGINFMWTPQFDSLKNPKVWLSAAGQVFFSLSLGMGAIQTYASYMKKKEDVVLNSMSSCFLNEFAEIIIGSAIIIPISIGYYGIDRVLELTNSGGFGLAFRSLPFLFGQWGNVLSCIAGFTFFGLLFLASITSTMALSMTNIAFFSDSFKWSQKKGAMIMGLSSLIIGVGPVLYFSEGVFDELDYWGGTFSLFVYAMVEAIVFSWVVGVDKGWNLINYGADIRLPKFFKYVLKYVTPTMLVIILITTLIKPVNDDWSKVSLKGWELDKTSILGEIMHKDISGNKAWFSKFYRAEIDGLIIKDFEKDGERIITFGTDYKVMNVTIPKNAKSFVKQGDIVTVGSPIYESGWHANKVFYIDLTRIFLVLLLVMNCILIYYSSKKSKFNEIEHDDMFE